MYSLKAASAPYLPIHTLEKVLSRRRATQLRFGFGIISAGGFSAAILLSITTGGYVEQALGVGFIAFGLWVEQLCLGAYYNTWHLRGADSVIGSGSYKKSGVTYEVAMLAFFYHDDITRGFFMEALGKEVALRLMLSENDLDSLWSTSRTIYNSEAIMLDERVWCTFTILGTYLYRSDQALKNFLTGRAISEETWVQTLRLVENKNLAYKQAERWWGRDQLAATTGIGRDLAFGVPYELEQFAESLYLSTAYADLADLPETRLPLVERIEEILARTKGANILLIGNPGVGAIDILVTVDKRLRTGRGLNALSGQHLIALDSARLCAAYPDPGELEQMIITLFEQSALAGNVTMVIDHISSFIAQTTSLGIPLPEILDTYLAIPDLHIIGVDTPHAYHTYLEPLGAFTRRFEEVLVDEGTAADTIPLLLSIAIAREGQSQLITTYDGVVTIYEAAERYINSGDMPQRAVTLLGSILDAADGTSTHLTPTLVYQYVSQITGVPVGPISKPERDRLLNLEDILHTRIIGQHEAIAAIARTMRRARVDIERHDKPIGTFLFLGPTGVGKTETAKALAYVFFGDESTMHRFDMSEFSDAGAVLRLIGTDGEPGILSNKIQEHPYSVILFDELEKSHHLVHDLLLQILDEGQFTNGRGETVNLRTGIIIATSNAASDLIMKTTISRTTAPILEQGIITHIINQKIFKPELLNRFDSTIIFEPLTQNQQFEVAQIMVKELVERIAQRGYQLSLEPALIAALAAKGYDPRFGARPMARVLQDMIEEHIATKIIAGNIQPGETVALTLNDFSSLRDT